MAKHKLQTQEIADVCSAHLTPGDMAVLRQLADGIRDEDCPLCVDEVGSGYMVLASTFGQADWPAAQREGLSREFLAIMQDAADQGCLFVFFQPWGFMHKGYPMFDHSPTRP